MYQLVYVVSSLAWRTKMWKDSFRIMPKSSCDVHLLRSPCPILHSHGSFYLLVLFGLDFYQKFPNFLKMKLGGFETLKMSLFLSFKGPVK